MRGRTLSRIAIFFRVALLAGLALPACGKHYSISYEVQVSESEPRAIEVIAEVSGAPRDSLVLNGFGGADVLRLSDVQASDPSSKPLAVQIASDTSSVQGRRIAIPRLVLRGPLPSRVRVRYRVQPGTREGDSHIGFTGVRYSYLGPRFGLVTGRSLFVLPQRGESVGPIRVRFKLPDGWQVVSPWGSDGAWLRPEIRGKLGAEHLVAATLGLGPFRERVFHVGRTRYRLAFAPGISDPQTSSVAEAIELATHRVRALFARDLGPDYLVVVAPASPDGEEIRGEAWGTGQGLTLAPVTAGRLHRYAVSLLDAYLRFAPFRVETHAPDEYWIVDGLANLYGWRSVAAAGLVDETEVERDLAASYLIARKIQGAEHDLERLYATKEGTETLSEVEAPFALAYLDRTLRSRSSGRDSLETVLRAMFRKRPAASLWTSLPHSQNPEWRTIHYRYIRGPEAIPAAGLFGLTAARPLPDPPAGRPTRRITIAFTGDTQGFLEHCGCKVNQSGGVARRATVIARLRRAHPGLPLLDLGNAFLRPEKDVRLDFLSREEQKLYLRTMERMRYDAMAIGTTELSFGAGWFREAGRGLRLPYLAANILEDREALAPGSAVIQSQGIRIGIVSVFEPPRGPGAPEELEANTAGLTFQDPVRATRNEIARLREPVDLVVVIGRLAPSTVHRIARECPDVDLVLSTASDGMSLVHVEGGTDAAPGYAQGFLGRTLVLYADSRNYGLETVDLGIDRDGRIASASTNHLWLYEDIPDDPVYRGMLSRFYDRVGRLDSAQVSVKALFTDMPGRRTGSYVGAARCAACHRAEYDQWKTTRHATAYKTLLDAHRHYQPKCIVCHVVGFRAPTGYRLGDPEEPLANVQCEICHGPGGAHVARSGSAPMSRVVSEAVCVECHNPEHSDHFVYVEKLHFVRHDYFESAHASAGAGPPP